MNYSNLSLDQTPPLAVPLRYFLTAPLFGLLGAVLLAAAGPGAFVSRWTPEVLGVTHLFTLGFMAMVMVGALQQLLPVLVGSPIPRPGRASTLLHVLLSTGVLCLGLGLYWQQAVLLIFAWPLLLAFLVAFGWIGWRSLRRSRSSHSSVRSMRLALSGFVITALLGLHLLAGHATPDGGPMRDLTDIHLAWGLLGWVAVLVSGVAYQVVPMFQMTPSYPRWMTPYLAPVLFAALAAWSLLAVGADRGMVDAGRLAPLAAAVVVAAVLLFAVATVLLQQRRRRRIRDVTMAYWRIGMGSMAVAAALWSVGQVWPERAGSEPLLLGVLMIQGFAVSVINGMLYKIVPFLTWLHLTNRIQSAGGFGLGIKIPNMKQVIPQARMRASLWLHGAALAALVAAVVLPQWLFYPALALLSVSNLVLFTNLVGAVRLYGRTAAAIENRAEA